MRDAQRNQRCGPRWIEQVNADRSIQYENARIGIAIR